MTRARALKQLIRARAARTGERYTTARRHLLSHPEPKTAAPPDAPVVKTGLASAPAAGGVSDRKFHDKTGHGLDHWFEVLDRFGGTDKGHTALARHLRERHNVDGWYSQSITVAYERARGARALNQRFDGDYEVSISKMVPATTMEVVRAFGERRLRRRWAISVDPQLVEAFSTALDSPKSKGIVVRPDGLGRFRYKWGGTTVQIYLAPKAGDKTSLVVTNSKLTGPAMVEERRTQWRAALAAVAAFFS